jgi:hypothetical protein
MRRWVIRNGYICGLAGLVMCQQSDFALDPRAEWKLELEQLHHEPSDRPIVRKVHP